MIFYNVNEYILPIYIYIGRDCPPITEKKFHCGNMLLQRQVLVDERY